MLRIRVFQHKIRFCELYSVNNIIHIFPLFNNNRYYILLYMLLYNFVYTQIYVYYMYNGNFVYSLNI